MRMIDADIVDVVIIYDKTNELKPASEVREYIKRQKAFLDKFPTIDAVPVVRCRDCKFRSSWMMNRNLRYICPESGMFPNCENDFCSYGKWKGGKDHA